mmetsp:Transcript_1257/g.2798  ORF Transcript_1257/g.2798 Transcript_1257/m.2798 type:complete len:574 (-) Transcript_1257:687-2408(-)|eukprot:CAMPEP_0179005882 /NCGR_PEP_ID=MMETSP0795-20121207/14218_1 /TAXON_ID=88552 /ORGANISM="Amoebophrya sp., Strain Ameob2" /LENGTH=573 /DNA_ID=CAMNT_0020700527 /DNA_START=223 /DNA_END=1944 /DNA_ORIENTATION=+
MNDFEYIYMKQRKDFGRYCQFDEVEPKIIGVVERNIDCLNDFVEQTVINVVLDNIPVMSEHSVNTARVQAKARGMLHTEGGWPKEVDATEAQDTTKWRKKLEKDPVFTGAVKTLTSATSKCLEQNNTIDLFEHYFFQEEPDALVENLQLKTVALFKDPSDEPRTISKIGWHPEGPTKIVGSYSSLRFQRMSEEMSTSSHVWDINERNVPLLSLRSKSPIISSQYNPKQSDLILSGCYNGILNLYDLRKGSTPAMMSVVETSHYDPVYDLCWLQSKTGTEAVSVSSDGRLMLWDVKEMDAPRDTCLLTDGAKNAKTLGAVSLEWMQEAGPTKYLVGTEMGMILSCQNKPKKPCEVTAWFGNEEKGGHGRHFGPVYGVKRNPFHVKYFLTIGDWSARMWFEDLKGPMTMTPYAPCYLSAASWSPTRPGVFFLARHDGYLDIWDWYYRMNAVSLTQKVSDHAITSMAMQSQGELLAMGDSNGIITLMQLCDGLIQMQPNEKGYVGAIFDRETKREKNLEALKKAQKQPGAPAPVADEVMSIDEKAYVECEEKFFAGVGMEGDNLGTSAYLNKKSQE